VVSPILALVSVWEDGLERERVRASVRFCNCMASVHESKLAPRANIVVRCILNSRSNDVSPQRHPGRCEDLSCKIRRQGTAQ
jgi:hypothetical protein